MNKLAIVLIVILVLIGGYFAYNMLNSAEEGQPEPTTQQVEVYFGHVEKTGDDCSKVFATEREIESTEGVGKAALQELLAGLTDEEKDEGYYTNINTGVEVNSLTIEDGAAEVDFSKELEERVGGSCRVTAIKAQIKETLKQFSTVDEVEISVEGETEAVLQP